jgi:hypothetical protein
MGKPHKGFSKLAKFTSMPYEDANERFKFDEADDVPPDGYNISLSDIFGDDPEEVFVFEGDVSVKGDLAIGAVGDYAGVYVILGNLNIDGVLDFTQVDGGGVLFVTGNLKAKTIGVAQEAQLWVGKDIEATDYILASVSDAGGLAVKGTANAKALIALDSETIAFGKKPKSTMKCIERTEGILDEDEYKSVKTAEDGLVKPFNSEEVDYEALMKAVKKGTKILA